MEIARKANEYAHTKNRRLELYACEALKDCFEQGAEYGQRMMSDWLAAHLHEYVGAVGIDNRRRLFDDMEKAMKL